MLSITLSFSLLLAVQGASDAAKVENTVNPRDAARDIKAVLKGDDLGEILEAYRGVGRVDDSGVVKAIGVGLRHDSLHVRWASLIALRYHPNKMATSEIFKNRKRTLLFEHQETAEEFYLALGQRADKRALRFITGEFGQSSRGPSQQLMMKRVLAVGRIREKEAVNELVKFLRSGFAGRRNRPSPVGDEICFALGGLTGHDGGYDTRGWVLWWNADRRNGWRVPKDPKPAPSIAKEWNAVWAEPPVAKMFAPVEDHAAGRSSQRDQGSRRGGEDRGGRRGRGGG